MAASSSFPLPLLLLGIAQQAWCDLPALSTAFAGGDADVTCYRIPAVVQTDAGTLVAFAEARHGSCSDAAVHEIAARRSVDGGLSWSAVAFASGNATVRTGNPVAIFDRRRLRIVLIFRVYRPGGAPSGSGTVFSEDDGLTWSPLREVDLGPATGSDPGPGAGAQTAEGRLLVVSHHNAYGHDLVSYSDDGGGSWVTINQTFPKMDEGAVAQLPDGSVMLNMRNLAEPVKGRAVAVSYDGGESFGPIAYDSTLVGPVCQGSLVSFGGAVFFSNPASPHGRDHITVRKSLDNGRTWPESVLVTSPASRGYSCLVAGRLAVAPSAIGGAVEAQPPTGFGGVVFEAAGELIQFARFPLNMMSASQRVVSQ